MVDQVLVMMKTVFAWCVSWTTSLLNAVGGGNVVLAAFLLVLIISLFLMPLRGSRISGNVFSDYMVGVIHKPKKSLTKKSLNEES